MKERLALKKKNQSTVQSFDPNAQKSEEQKTDPPADDNGYQEFYQEQIKTYEEYLQKLNDINQQL